MKTETLKAELTQALKSTSAQSAVNCVCRKYLSENIKEKYPSVINKLTGIIESCFYPLNYEICQTQSKEIQKSTGNDIWLIAGFVALGCFLSNKLFTAPTIGSISGFVLGYYAVNTYRKRSAANGGNLPETILDQPQLKITTTVDEIARSVFDVFENLDVLGQILINSGGTSSYPLEENYLEVLVWIRRMIEKYRNNDRLQVDLIDIIENCGYECSEYSDLNEGWFEKTIGNVTIPKTSLPALVNSQTKKCIIKGHAIMPRF